MPTILVIAGVDAAFVAFLFFLRRREKTPQYRMPVSVCLLLSVLFVVFSFPAAPVVDSVLKDMACNVLGIDNVEHPQGSMANKLK